ncbi:hypothetical protein [uncultured Draconibacterium sp.]|uniref:hypothetical protein n=1 Tax=uncultured Draconibacterium sp. TaxID=1573823 RepID=UPI0032167A18
MMQFFSKRNYPEVEGMDLKYKLIEWSGSVEFSLCFEDRKIIYYITTKEDGTNDAWLQFCIQPSSGDDCIFDNLIETFKEEVHSQEIINYFPTWIKLVTNSHSEDKDAVLMKIQDVTGGNEKSNDTWQYMTVLNNIKVKEFGDERVIQKVFDSYSVLNQLFSEIEENRDKIDWV